MLTGWIFRRNLAGVLFWQVRSSGHGGLPKSFLLCLGWSLLLRLVLHASSASGFEYCTAWYGLFALYRVCMIITWVRNGKSYIIWVRNDSIYLYIFWFDLCFTCPVVTWCCSRWPRVGSNSIWKSIRKFTVAYCFVLCCWSAQDGSFWVCVVASCCIIAYGLVYNMVHRSEGFSVISNRVSCIYIIYILVF